MKSSEQINELTASLVKAQAACKAPALDETNPHFKNRYASLAAVREAVMPAFLDHGLAVVQAPGTAEGGPVLHTTIFHTSGQWLELEPFRLPVARADAQAHTGGLTYARRVSLQALAGVVAEEDDDGNEASRPAPAPARKEAAAPAAPLLSSARRRAIVELASDLGLNRETMLNIMEAEFSVSSTAQLTPGQADALMGIMRAQGQIHAPSPGAQGASTSAGGGRSPAAASGGRR